LDPLPIAHVRAAARAQLGAIVLAVGAFALIVLGALVRANGAGLACPDWPLCFGQLVPQFDFRIALEWGHRAFAGGLSLGFAALTFALVRVPALRARTARVLVVGWILLAVQIVLGGLTVLLGLAPWTVTAHLLCGNGFCALLVWIASDLRAVSVPPGVGDAPTRVSGAARLGVALVAGAVLLQLTLGGLVSSHYAGLACADFPTCDGVSVAPAWSGPVGLHVLHRFGAYALVVVSTALAFAAGDVGRLARSGLRLILLQVAVGVANVWLRLPVEVTALHSALAAGIFLMTTLLVREAFHGVRAELASAPPVTERAREVALG
jgi:cytochrome c oxidase assembly protein subunit 15